MLFRLSHARSRKVEILLAIAFCINLVFWFSVKDIRGRWGNVPPAPERGSAAFFGLGDAQLAYRLTGLMIQNLGDSGGRVTALKDYNYDELTKWFYVEDSLDSHSDYIPYLAAYYFSAVQTPESFRPVLDYLSMVGQRSEGEKWRFLAQASFLARKDLKDMDKSVALANMLVHHKRQDLPEWTKYLPALILSQKGDKEASYDLIVELLRSSGDKLDPSEVNNMHYMLCHTILTPDQARKNPLCKNYMVHK